MTIGSRPLLIPAAKPDRRARFVRPQLRAEEPRRTDTRDGCPTVLPERNLDILRALAVLAVLVDHVLETLGNHHWYVRWIGQAGVQAFFVHTSLVLMSSLERDGGPARSHWVARFYVRRALRIYPLAWAAVAVVLLLHVPALLAPAPWVRPPTSAIAANFALLQDLLARGNLAGNLWTLPIELQMYLALPLCYLVARRASAKAMCAMIFVGVLLSVFYLWGSSPGHEIRGLARVRMLRFVPCFLMGVAAYWTLRNHPEVRPRLPAWTWAPIALAAGIIFYFPWVMLPGIGVTSWPARALYCAMIAIAIPLVRDTASSVWSRGAHVVATYSYAIYLLHPMAVRAGFWLLRDRPLPVQWTVFAMTLVVSVYAAHHLVEKPGIELGRRLANGRWPWRLPLPAVPAAP